MSHYYKLLVFFCWPCILIYIIPLQLYLLIAVTSLFQGINFGRWRAILKQLNQIINDQIVFLWKPLARSTTMVQILFPIYKKMKISHLYFFCCQQMSRNAISMLAFKHLPIHSFHHGDIENGVSFRNLKRFSLHLSPF